MSLAMVCVSGILFVVLGFGIYTYRISHTKHGYLDWRFALLLRFAGLHKKPIYDTSKTPEQNRARLNQKLPVIHSKYKKIEKIYDLTITENNIPARVYIPTLKKPSPLVVYYHGGGFVMGNIETFDNLCRAIASSTPCVVVSIDYRLAPEHPFPAAVEDAWDSANWIYNNAQEFNGLQNQFYVAGDSAGGNLAAVTALRARDMGGMNIKGQILIYPAVSDITKQTPTQKKYSKGFLLSAEDLITFAQLYFPDANPPCYRDTAPLEVDDLSKLPGAFILTAEFDPLRSSCEAYATKLQQARVPVMIKQYQHMIHGFINYCDFVSTAGKAVDDIARFIRTKDGSA